MSIKIESRYVVHELGHEGFVSAYETENSALDAAEERCNLDKKVYYVSEVKHIVYPKAQVEEAI